MNCFYSSLFLLESCFRHGFVIFGERLRYFLKVTIQWEFDIFSDYFYCSWEGLNENKNRDYSSFCEVKQILTYLEKSYFLFDLLEIRYVVGFCLRLTGKLLFTPGSGSRTIQKLCTYGYVYLKLSFCLRQVDRFFVLLRCLDELPKE